MDRMAAAAHLGVAIDAGRDEVQAAFRQRARAVHPDTARHGGADLDALTQARDAMLAVATPTQSSPAASNSSAASAHTTHRPKRAPKRPSVIGRGFGLLGALVVLAIVGIIIWTVAAGTERTGDIAVDECLLVTPESVDTISCDQFGAQRVVTELSAGGQCPTRTNSLIVGATTWCLAPADAE